jgi:hypothetical protein
MGNRHDMVASDLDASNSRRNECRQGSGEKAMAMTAGTERERAFITALNTYYNTPDSPQRGRGWTILSWASGGARSGGRL